MKYIISHGAFLLLGILLGVVFTVQIHAAQKQIERNEEKTENVSAEWKTDHLILNKANLLNELKVQGVKFPEIVLAQAILETGHFKSYICRNNNNLFGLKSGNTYMKFTHWTESVAAYKEYIQNWKKPPKDYYKYLKDLGYAKDPEYTKKLKEIVRK